MDFKKKIFTKVGILILLVVLAPIVYTSGSILDGFRINFGTTEPRVIDAHNNCYNVINTVPSDDFFVPTRTLPEWLAFIATYMDLRPNDIYPCELPNTQCRLAYQYKIDNKIGDIKYTPWTDNTTAYATGPYSLVKTGKDDHCNGSQACGIRVGVQCASDSSYEINVIYEMIFEGISGGARSTGYPISGGFVQWGAWSERQYETGDSECSSPAGCRVEMTIENNYTGTQPVTCSIGYQHRTDEEVSGFRYDGVEAVATNVGSGDGENCESGGCGLQAALYCAGPPAGIGSPPLPTSSQVPGECGPADGEIYDGGLSGEFPPAPGDRCSSGSVSDFSYSPEGSWNWNCIGSGENLLDVLEYCSAFNIDFNRWNPQTDPGGGGPGICEGDCFVQEILN